MLRFLAVAAAATVLSATQLEAAQRRDEVRYVSCLVETGVSIAIQQSVQPEQAFNKALHECSHLERYAPKGPFGNGIISEIANRIEPRPTHQWIYDIGSDPVTDEPWTVAVLFPIARAAKEFGVVVKCFESKPPTFMIAITTQERYDRAASYPDALRILIRADKELPYDLPAHVENADGKVAYAAYSEETYKVREISMKIFSAKTIAVSFESLSMAATTKPNIGVLTAFRMGCGGD